MPRWAAMNAGKPRPLSGPKRPFWQIEVEDFPAFIVVDDKGNDFFAHFMRPAE